MSRLVLALPLLLAGCPKQGGTESAARTAALEARVMALEARVQRLESSGGAVAGVAAEPTLDQEAAASDLATRINEAIEGWDYQTAASLCTELDSPAYQSTRATRGMSGRCDELAVVGKEAGTIDVESWFQGYATLDEAPLTLVVFWEAWCPHCRRELPEIQGKYERYRDRGLQVVALTRVTKSSTDEKVREFLSENDITFPVAKEGGETSDDYGVRGIPAAALVRDGQIIWRGHPARITDEDLEALLDGRR